MYDLVRQFNDQIVPLDYNDQPYSGRYIKVHESSISQFDLHELKNHYEIGRLIFTEDLVEKAKKHKVSNCRVQMAMMPMGQSIVVHISFYMSKEEEFIYKLTA
jgi:hypothetical protein